MYVAQIILKMKKRLAPFGNAAPQQNGRNERAAPVLLRHRADNIRIYIFFFPIHCMVPAAQLYISRRNFFKDQRMCMGLFRCIPYRCFDHIGSGRKAFGILAVHIHDEVAFFNGIS